MAAAVGVLSGEDPGGLPVSLVASALGLTAVPLLAA
jgi:hypothetical protein